jgi:hypothetical protein
LNVPIFSTGIPNRDARAFSVNSAFEAGRPIQPFHQLHGQKNSLASMQLCAERFRYKCVQ